jgi:UDP-2,4-diacetamido-2,4,6-trideoxy-beta-L-altropyranose hydrolase
MRCLALAQAWQDLGGHAIFVTAMDSLGIEARLRSEGMDILHLQQYPGSIEDARFTADFANQLNASWVVTDGYEFNGEYQRIIKECGLSLLFIDDNGHADHYFADVVLNQNIHAHEALYANREPYTKLLLGPRFILLRREFLKWQSWERQIPGIARKHLVTLGGSDPDNVTLKVICALREVDIDLMELIFVIGPTNANIVSIQKELFSVPFHSRVLPSIEDMSELMAWADVAISGAGTTSWESVFMGLPAVVVVLAENQSSIADGLDEFGVAVNMGRHRDISPHEMAKEIRQLGSNGEKRSKMLQRARNLVDGDGTNRVLNCIEAEKLRLRKVNERDCEIIWKWANDPETRKASFSSTNEEIPWDDHLEWFNLRINDQWCKFYVGMDAEGEPVGEARYDMKNNEAIISVVVDRQVRNMGYGTELIKLSARKIFKEAPVDLIHAYLKQDNLPSMRAFSKAGFEEQGIENIDGEKAIHFVLRRATLDRK